MAFIKTSICLTILHIAIVRWQRILLWTMISVSFACAAIINIFICVQCTPIEGSWGAKDAKCFPQAAKVSLTFCVSGLNILTDFGTAILPILIIKNLQMPKKRKMALMGVLGAGILASTATLARIPYATAYFENKDYMGMCGLLLLACS
jgi:hypothetical protein